MELETRITRLEALDEAHYDEFKEMYQNNREDHSKFFGKLEDIGIELTEVKDMTNNHLKHHERLFVMLCTMLGMLVPFLLLLVGII